VVCGVCVVYGVWCMCRVCGVCCVVCVCVHLACDSVSMKFHFGVLFLNMAPYAVSDVRISLFNKTHCCRKAN